MNLILLVVVIVAALAIGIPTGFRSCSTSTSNGELATVKPTAATPDEVETTVAQTSVVEATVKVNANKAKKKNATKSTKADTEATEPQGFRDCGKSCEQGFLRRSVERGFSCRD